MKQKLTQLTLILGQIFMTMIELFLLLAKRQQATKNLSGLMNLFLIYLLQKLIQQEIYMIENH